MKKVVSLVIVFIVLLASISCQQQPSPELQPTDYQSNKDVYLVFHGKVIKGVTSLLPLSVVSGVTFKLQEGTHSSVRDVSQAEIDHYYIWVCLEEACIPVDPFSYSN
jgi:hypothetical protein